MNPVIYIVLAFSVLGIIIVLVTVVLRKMLLPHGSIHYADTDSNPGALLTSERIPLVGKPDYILKRKDTYIPVEVKTGKTPITPYKNHLAQLFAYCYLVDEHFKKRPLYGIVRYPEKELELEYTPQAEKGVEQIVIEIVTKKQSGAIRQGMKQVCRSCREAGHTT